MTDDSGRRERLEAIQLRMQNWVRIRTRVDEPHIAYMGQLDYEYMAWLLSEVDRLEAEVAQLNDAIRTFGLRL